MTSDIGAFEIQECRLLSVSFYVNKTSTPDKQVEVGIDLSMEHNYNDKDNILSLVMGFDVTGKGFDMNLSIKYEGIFKFNKKPTPLEHLEKTAEITCAAILFPFIREAIADLTRRAGFPPLILDPIHFVKLYNHNHPKISE